MATQCSLPLASFRLRSFKVLNRYESLSLVLPLIVRSNVTVVAEWILSLSKDSVMETFQPLCAVGTLHHIFIVWWPHDTSICVWLVEVFGMYLMPNSEGDQRDSPPKTCGVKACPATWNVPSAAPAAWSLQAFFVFCFFWGFFFLKLRGHCSSSSPACHSLSQIAPAQSEEGDWRTHQ